MACAGAPVRCVIGNLELVIPYYHSPRPTSVTRLATGKHTILCTPLQSADVQTDCNLELHGCGMWKTL